MTTDNILPDVEYKRILYVTDLSESGRKAFPHAASLARRFGSELVVFHVVDPGNLEDLLGYATDEVWEQLANQSREEAMETLVSRKRDHVEIRNNVQRHCDQALSSETDAPIVSYEIKVQMGNPLECILDEAHNGNYDILIISKHGHRLSVKDAVIGDTARRVVRRCNIPVAVIPVSS